MTEKAKGDLQDIGRYTQKTWGRDQRNRYLQQIDEAFHDLSQNPDKGQNCDDLREGYQKFSIGKHFIFYRMIKPHHIEIVRVLHGRMNIEQQLTEH